MTDREKLIELLNKQKGYTLPIWIAPQAIEILVDALLANGVTVQKWIPVTEMEPERTGWFLSFGPQRKTAVVHFDSDGVWSDEDDYNIDVTHWMPLPKPPEDGGAENETE